MGLGPYDRLMASDRPSQPAARTPKGKSAAPGGKKRAKSFASLASAMRWLDGRVNLERTRESRVDPDAFKLDRTRALLTELGEPQQSVRFLHVAGSKGKGSVVEMLGSCLSACGLGVGVYTSPHLMDVRERVRINDQWISEADFVRLLAKVATAADRMPAKHGEPSYFECMTCLAMVYFAEQAVDVAVLEVGLGGRLDATNVVMPEVTAITAIQLEHANILGDTVEKIAAEKAGIMKPGVPCITMQQEPAVMEVLRAKAEEVGATLEVLGSEVDFSYRFEASPELGPHARVCVTSPHSNFEHLAVPLKGEHQALNCGIALAMLDRLRERGIDTPERFVAEGLAKTPANGRMEMAWHSPRIILDGAHTPESLEGLVRAIGAHVRYDSMVMIFGCAADKDVPGLLAKIDMGADKVIFTRAVDNPRASDPAELRREFEKTSTKMTQVADSLEEAVKIAVRATGRGDLIVVTGSFHLAGEAKRFLAERAARRTESKAAPAPQSARPQAGTTGS